MTEEEKQKKLEEAKAEVVAPADASESSKKEKKADKKAKDDEFKKTSSLHIKIYSPFQTYYDDDAESISAENKTGPFDVLAQHHNFITLLVPCELDIKSSKGGDKKIKINRAVMHVRRNIVTVFLDV
jgi:ATP synthase, Delta/Epsilon chain, beta-sandwich domain